MDMGFDVQNESKSSESVELNTSRRRVLSVMGVAGSGVLGLNSTIETVSGSSIDEVPIVHTRDRQDNPIKVRMIPRERRRRINLFTKFPAQEFLTSHPNVSEVSLKQRSKDDRDLSIHLHLKRNTESVRQALPNQIQDVPVTYEDALL